jgi:hypothetical protein
MPGHTGDRSKAARLRGALVGAFVALAAAVPAAAQAQGWVKTANGCQVWSAPAQAGETVTWSGACQGGKASGKGVLVRSQGSTSTRFEGAMVEGRETGQGVKTWSSGSRYEGNFRNGVADGRGTMTTRGMTYVGDWKDGQRTGQGVFTMPDGTRYSGQWVNGKQEGQGTQVFANGSRYEGQWKNGLPNGPGTGYGAATGRVFRGTFRNGCVNTGEFIAAFGVPNSACQ